MIIKLKNVVLKIGDVTVSTVFLGIDHSMVRPMDQEHEPILFETMIFGGEHHNYQQRYVTWDEAKAGHLEAVKLIE